MTSSTDELACGAREPEPRVGSGDTESKRAEIRCEDAFWTKLPHAPHNWRQRPDAEPVHCPGVFVPEPHYVDSNGVDCCVHTIPVGPDSCRACRELADD